VGSCPCSSDADRFMLFANRFTVLGVRCIDGRIGRPSYRDEEGRSEIALLRALEGGPHRRMDGVSRRLRVSGGEDRGPFSAHRAGRCSHIETLSPDESPLWRPRGTDVVAESPVRRSSGSSSSAQGSRRRPQGTLIRQMGPFLRPMATFMGTGLFLCEGTSLRSSHDEGRSCVVRGELRT
jgi:hypothetical protein